MIEDTTQYVKDGLEHLVDGSIYEKVDMDTTLVGRLKESELVDFYLKPLCPNKIVFER